MKIFTSVKELRAELETAEQSGIGFVPTMGALHAGHRSLVERARRENATVVVSVFVNPTQFNDKNDLRHYPRTPEADARLLERAGADFVLMPSVKEIYPEPDGRQFDFGQIDKVMEGATRPGHFNGVAQVVSRLFDIVRPARAYFGEKDFQQIAVVKAMVDQLSLPVEIVECEIVRGEDGLALSSRNALLDAEHRAAAPQIYAALRGRKAHRRKHHAPPVMPLPFSQRNPGGIVLSTGNHHIVVYSCGKIASGNFQLCPVGIAALCQILAGSFFNRSLLFSQAADGFLLALFWGKKFLNIVQNQTADFQLDLLVCRTVAVC